MKPPRQLLKTGADAALPTVRLTRRVRRLEEGVRENALLAGPLEELVDAIEQSLVPCLESAHARAEQRAERVEQPAEKPVEKPAGRSRRG